ncbi:Ig-like domain-containing protein [Pseudomonas aeruginosa]
MKNLIDSRVNFSVITEKTVTQAYTLDSSRVGLDQVLVTQPSNLYVLQAPAHTSLENVLTAERSGKDLLLAFRSQEQAQPALKFDQFFANNGRLHVLKQDGELLRAIVSKDVSQQGLVDFDLRPASTAEQQLVNPVLGVLQQALFPVPEASAPVQLAALGITVPPQIIHAIDQVGIRQGLLASGNVTDDRYATLEGTGTPGAHLEIFDNGLLIGEVQVEGNGHWRFEPDRAFDEGGHLLTARAQGSGETSAAFSLFVDTIAPSPVNIDSIYDDRAGGQAIEHNGHTSNNTPIIKGRGEPLSMVAIYSGKAMLGTCLVDDTGNWTFSSPFIMPDGEYAISATAMDFSGNVSLSSAIYQITIDTTPPIPPTIQEAIDDAGVLQGKLASGAITDDSTPTLSGKAEAGTTVFIYDNNNLAGSVLVDANGDWSFTPPSELNDGEHSFTAVACDLAGNLSISSAAFSLKIGPDVTQTPTIDMVIDDAGPMTGALLNGSHTDDATVTLHGTAQAGDTVRIYDNGVLIGEVQTDAQGKWSFTPAPALSEGPHAFQAQAINATHSPSDRSPPFELVLDLTPPDASRLSITSIYDDVGSITGNVPPNGRTDDCNPRISGTGTAGDTIIVYVQDTSSQREVGRAQVEENGKWSLEVAQPLAYGKNTFTAMEIDPAGNATLANSPYSIIIGDDVVGGYDLNSSTNSSSQINSTTLGNQSNPQVTKLANGNLIVVWQQHTLSAASGYDVMMQMMDPTGTQKLGPEQLVNQISNNNQDSPQVVALADGGYLVVWESYAASPLDKSGDGVFARHYGSDGTPLAGEFLVNQTTVGAQRAPEALSMPDGGYIISWYSAQDKSSIMQRTYDANDRPMGNEVVVQAGGANNGWGGPEMASFENSEHAGWYITVWTGAGGGTNGNDIMGQLRKFDGSVTGPVMNMNTTRDNQQYFPDVITLKDGSFVVFWESYDKQAIGSDVRAAHYSLDPTTGTTKLIGGGDFIVNDYRTSKQYKPVGVPLDDGGYMLFWGSYGGDGSGSAIYGQRFDADSNKVGHEFLVNPITKGNQGVGCDNLDMTHMLDATVMENGHVFVTWQSDNIDGNSYGIEGVVVDIDAGFYSEFQVNNATFYEQSFSTSTALAGGNYVVAWQSKDSGNLDIKAQLFNAQGMPIGQEFLVSTEMGKYHQQLTNLTTLADGSFIAVWQSAEGVNTIRSARYTYTYDEQGQVTGTQRIGGEQIINTSPNGVLTYLPFVTPLDDGGYLISWVKSSPGWTAVSRQYDAGGQPVTGEIVIGTLNHNLSGAVLATLADGQVAAAYSGPGTDKDIYVRVYDPITHTYGSAIVANQTLAGRQGNPNVTALSNGNFIVSWDSTNNSGPDQSGCSVWARVYSPQGQPQGNEFLVNTFTPGHQQKPVLEANPHGGFVAVYQSAVDTMPGNGTFGIYLQCFDNSGNRVGPEMRINQLVMGQQTDPDITFLSDGRLFVTWTDRGVGDGSGTAVKGRIIDLDTTLSLAPQDDASSSSVALLVEPEGHGGLWMLLDDGSSSGLLLSDTSLSSVQGGSGNDVVGIRDTSFASINGGEGIDTLLIDGRKLSLDIDNLIDRINGIEKIDLGRGNANNLSLSADALDHLGIADMVQADGKNQFVINGDASNSIQLKDTPSESWTEASQTEIGGVVYHTYISGSTELLIEQPIHVTVL